MIFVVLQQLRKISDQHKPSLVLEAADDLDEWRTALVGLAVPATRQRRRRRRSTENQVVDYSCEPLGEAVASQEHRRKRKEAAMVTWTHIAHREPTRKLDGTHGEDARRLREFIAFDKFSDDELERLVQAAHHTSRSAAWPLIHEKTPPDACYVLLSGEAAVYVGRDRIALVGPGEVIGESILRRGILRNATVTTTGAAEVLRIDRDDLASLLDEIPALRETMHMTAARHHI
jgi:hypothetical protein